MFKGMLFTGLFLFAGSSFAALPLNPSDSDLMEMEQVGEGVKTVVDYQGNRFPARVIYSDGFDNLLIRGDKSYRTAPTEDNPEGVCIYSWYEGTGCSLTSSTGQCEKIEIIN